MYTFGVYIGFHTYVFLEWDFIHEFKKPNFKYGDCVVSADETHISPSRW